MWGLSVLTTILAILLFATSADAIVEEVTGPFCSGMDYLLVSFCNNPDKAIECGGFRQIEEFDQHTDPPDLVRFSKANLNSYYTLIMADPDAPSHADPYSRYWIHWLVMNVKGSDVADGNVFTADTLTEYTTPKPPPGSGPHRYYFLLYKQFEFRQDPESLISREGFDIASFALQQQLDGPVAGTMFRTQAFCY
ncbi:protein D2-like [Apostichopus japonicus]|uniref:protein D2-like n=1 Tax=Stichopus japonicus TaxID=307972 RepID=UPI003AB27B06